MSTAFVCSANPEYRSECDAGCESCSFLIGDRRDLRPGRIQWSRFERRSLMNLLPSPSLEYAGAPVAVAATVRRELPASWYPLVFLTLFNLIDCLMTSRALSLGYTEGNPLMAALLEVNLPLAMLLKSLLVGAGAYVLWRFRHLGIASRGLTLLTVVYGLLVAYHLSFQLAI